jgi:hypothetical protein
MKNLILLMSYMFITYSIKSQVICNDTVKLKNQQAFQISEYPAELIDTSKVNVVPVVINGKIYYKREEENIIIKHKE